MMMFEVSGQVFYFDLNEISIADAMKAVEKKNFDIEETDFNIDTNNRLLWVLKHMGMHIADLKREGKF